ncbi:MAG: hypothetical protein ACRD10_03280, partial [Terriglobia bacterium]
MGVLPAFWPALLERARRAGYHPMNLEQKLEELQRRSSEAERGGGGDRGAQQKAAGKLTARERLETLFD